ncbi:MAG: hypothetical protein NVSMB14_10690 [Isosphaeraceae bacterium]
MNLTPESPRNDADALFSRAKAGDQSAWDELYRACQPKLVRAVRRRLNLPMRSLYDSLDFVGDVWESLVAKPEKFDFDSMDSLLAFMAKSAQRKVIDAYRRLHTQKNDVARERSIDAAGEDGPAREPASSDPTPSTIVSFEEDVARLSVGLDREQREALDLKRAGHTNEEIAERFGWHLRKVQRFFQRLNDSWPKPGDPS